MKPKHFNAGTWVRFGEELGLIAHYAPYAEYDHGLRKQETYMVYFFSENGDYIEASWVQRRYIKKTKTPDFAADIVLFPNLLAPVDKHEQEEGYFKSGFFYNDLVIIDTMSLNAELLKTCMQNGIDDIDCDGAVWSKNSWQHKFAKVYSKNSSNNEKVKNYV